MKQNQIPFEEVHIISEMETIFIQVIIKNPKSTIVNNSMYSLCHYKAGEISLKLRTKSSEALMTNPCEDPGGIGGQDSPWKITSYMGIYRN